jgi:hypothetical protein
MQYRATPHSKNHISPAELMFGRQTDMNDSSPCEIPNNKFSVGDPAKFRVYADRDN